jgi:hypothetical protein
MTSTARIRGTTLWTGPSKGLTAMSDLFEPDVLASLLRQWSRRLRARNRSPRTVETYTDSAQELAAFARRHGHAELDRALIEDYLADQASRWKPARWRSGIGRCSSSPSG